jgi:hypothetical protein
MTRTLPGWSLLMAVAVVAWLLAAPAPVAAQRAVPRGGGSQPSGGGGQGSGGQGSGGGQSGGGQSGGSAPRGGSVERAPSGDGGTRTGVGSAREGGGRTRNGGNASGQAGGSSSSEPRATVRGSTGDSDGGDAKSSGTGDPVSAYSRPRAGRPQTGDAVARTSRPPASGGTTIYVPGGYYDGYYGSYYPWSYGGLGLGGYYGGYYDPWFDGGYQGYYSGGADYEGRLRLKVKPKEAQVFVDGYFAGIVDDFDGVFQRLHIETGPHRIELRADGYEPLSLEVRIQPGRTLTYKGELKKLP